MTMVERLYAAAARAGLLVPCTWQPSSGDHSVQSALVGYTAADATVLDGLGLSTEHTITFPSSVLVGLAPREVVDVGCVAHQVREVRRIGDGSEVRATLTRL